MFLLYFIKIDFAFKSVWRKVFTIHYMIFFFFGIILRDDSNHNLHVLF